MWKMNDKELLKNHTNIEWVKKAGLVMLEYATQENFSPSFSVKDIIVMVKFIDVMNAQELYILRNKILNCLTVDTKPASFNDLLVFDEDTTIAEKKQVRDLMNKVIFEHVETIATYVKKYDTNEENMAMKNLLEFAIYANEQEKLNHGKLIWEIMREIASKIPQDPDNPFAPIEAKKMSSEKTTTEGDDYDLDD
ncbi:MAG: hypothetical protein WD512_20625 [Candidatus Paceibacterota bacterium]